ncbi:FRG domain-containing protein [Leucobacter insecticola]|uniref:FRG domain-containing protein n=1 Tax=Leucobacter insecticola TaxID=2714934 RepID=A0A6G8FKI4_9MICO|nr:FRG domain-containing protein [Leucobacter insecticola]QIM16582.1 FRG domain-containing protein [Leucobacter insecticola]
MVKSNECERRSTDLVPEDDNDGSGGPKPGTSDDSVQPDEEAPNTYRSEAAQKSETENDNSSSVSAQEIAARIASANQFSHLMPTVGNKAWNDALSAALSGPAKEAAARIASANQFSHLMPTVGNKAWNDALSAALSGPAKEAAARIASANQFSHLMPTVGNKAWNDALSAALSGPAHEIAAKIASANEFNHWAIDDANTVWNDEVRNSLTPATREAADRISKSSLGWLQNYSGQTLEPALYARVARELANESFDSPESDYEPIRFESYPEDKVSTPAAIFERFEVTVESLSELMTQLDELTRRLAPLTVTWRGQANANWGLHSTLHREVRRAKEPIGEGLHQTANTIPTEREIVAAERYLLADVGARWRLGSSPAVETLARMQHRGIPTRLLDATRNPLLALWFAVTDPETAETDARLIAVAHRAVSQIDDSQAKEIDKAFWSEQYPFWFDFSSPKHRVTGAWGTGTRLREVIPPDYDKRILAQNAVFLLDGAPAITESVLERYNEIVDGDWRATDIAASMSVVLAPCDPSKTLANPDSDLSLTYSFRIPARLKEPIRETLKRTYGLDWETIYPDMEGIKGFLEGEPEWFSHVRETYL